MSEELVRETVRLEDEHDRVLLQEIGRELGAQVEPKGVRSSVDPVSLLMSVTATAAVVTLTIETWRERRQGGQVIDLRPDAAKVIHRDRNVLFGYVVILFGDGRVEVHLKEPANHLAAIIEKVVTSGLGGGPEDGGEIASVDQVLNLIDMVTEGQFTVTTNDQGEPLTTSEPNLPDDPRPSP